jgi:lysophospholipase L1-like esterase
VSPQPPRASGRAARTARRLAERAVLVAFGLLVATLTGELGLRLLQGEALWPPLLPEPYVDNALLYRESATRLYELNPGADGVVGRNRVHIRVNAAGMRDDREYPLSKPAGVRRVVVLGDSFSFAGKVALEQTFPKQLEARMNAAEPGRYEVLNLAVPGYNSRQQMLLLAERGLAYAPDLVLVAFVLNDAVPAAQLVPRHARVPLRARRLLKRLLLVQFLAGAAKRLPAILAGRRFKGGSEAADLVPGSPGWATVQASLLEIQRLAAQGGADMLVAIWPMFEGLDGDYPFGAEHAQVARLCADHGIDVLDLLPTFKGTKPDALWVARDDHHPNADAQRAVAEALFGALRRRGFVAGPEP